MSSSETPQPQRTRLEVDWTKVGDVKDTTLPVATPIVQAILDRLPALPAGSVVLDLACGAGLPSFAFARDQPLVEVLGVDRTPELIELARFKAGENGIGNARFEVMSLDRLELADDSAHAAVSHFGFLAEGNIAESVRELARVLVPGAPFSIAVFDDMALNTLMSTIERGLAAHVPEETLPDFPYLTRLAAAGLRERLLREAGFTQVESEMVRWSVPIASFDTLLGIATSPVPFGRALESLDDSGIEQVRHSLKNAANEFQTEDPGAYVFPMACRMFWGHR